ncbi:MAG: hypothetical protein JXX29_19820 [Deltaproteobacteria bacterium]|nr:hypothetical protein [Deltaproteobacteria bacterium]
MKRKSNNTFYYRLKWKMTPWVIGCGLGTMLCWGCENVTVEGDKSNDNDSVENNSVDTETETDSSIQNANSMWDNIPSVISGVCPSADEIMDITGVCVPQCDATDRCYVSTLSWGGDMVGVSGDEVYFRQDAVVDELENEVSPQRLWRVDMATGVKALVIDDFTSHRIVGEEDGLLVVLDARQVPAELNLTSEKGERQYQTLPDEMNIDDLTLNDTWVYSGGHKKFGDPKAGIWRLKLGSDDEPELFIPAGNFGPMGAAVAAYPEAQLSYIAPRMVTASGDDIWFAGDMFVCGFNLYEQVPRCTYADMTIGEFGHSSEGYLLYDEMFWVEERSDENGNLDSPVYLTSISGAAEKINVYAITENIFMAGGENFWWTAGLAAGWGYVVNPIANVVERFPLSVGISPEPLFSTALVPLPETTPLYFGPHMHANMLVLDSSIAVARPVQDADGNTVRTIFINLPLAPRPCTPALPCADDEQCSAAGFCESGHLFDTDPDTDTDTSSDTDSGSDSDADTDTGTDTESTPGFNDIVSLTGCGCNDTTEACGADGECIPRCDSLGRCIEGVVDGELLPWAETLTFDSSGERLFVKQRPQTDFLGNPISNYRLWEIDMVSGNTILWADIDEEFKFWGTMQDGVVVAKYLTVPIEVQYYSEPEQLETNIYLPEFASEYDSVLAEDSILFLRKTNVSQNNEYHLWRMSLTTDAVAEIYVEASVLSGTDTGDPYGWISYSSNGKMWSMTSDRLCHFEVNDASTITCYQNPSYFDGYKSVVQAGNYLYMWDIMVDGPVATTMDAEFNMLNVYQYPPVCNTEEWPGCKLYFYKNWAYGFESGNPNFISFPLFAAREPQVLYPRDYFVGSIEPDSGMSSGLSVGAGKFVWLYSTTAADNYTIRTLVLSAPLPPHMCDAELPCTGEGETCGADGFCATGK